MSKPLKPSGRRSNARGIALILTLAIMALVTLIVIGFAVSMRVQNAASKNMNDVLKARELARAAVDQVVAQIRQATTRGTSTSGTVLSYVTFPGGIYNFFSDATTNGATLYSMAATIPPTSETFDMNDAVNNNLWITGKGGEFPASAASEFPVGWVYVGQDNTVTPPAAYLAPPNAYPMVLPTPKPIIGRFAYWVDDEASKININTAGHGWTTSDPYGDSNPLAIGLDQVVYPALTPLSAYAPDIEQGYSALFPPALPRGDCPYTTTEEVRRANPNTINATVYDASRFSITAYSNDANATNPPVDLDFYGRNRLRIDNLNTSPDVDGRSDGAFTRLSDPNLMKVCTAGGTVNAFQSKYGLDGLRQIIANIIGYQLNPRLAGDLARLPDSGGDPPAYLGLIKVPYVNEVQVKYDTTGVGLKRTISIELFYPYGADGVNYLTGPADTILVTDLPAVPGSTLPQNLPAPITVTPGVTLNSATPYYVVTYSDSDLSFAVPSSGSVLVTVATNATVDCFRSGKRLDCAEVPFPNGAILADSVTWHGAEVNDPCLNENTAEWSPYRNPAGTLGGQNSAYAPPGGDTSKMLMRGSAMLSVGELGYIHTLNSWTYLHLQPQPSTEKTAGQIPDWAMLDIFTVPGFTTEGRININSRINPELLPVSPTTPRLVPLEALLSTVVPSGSLQVLAQNIYNRVYKPVAPTGDLFGNSTVYDTIGEICEVQGMDNGQTREADKEAIIRRIANLITVRSNTFTIWIIAQSIRDRTDAGTLGKFDVGTDVIAGEARAKVVVERVQNPGPDGIYGTIDDTVSFRVRYFRYL
ncbi:MAG TPA: hypothetical protein VL486_14710 [Verrucomicrobiae bacterium]|nr:hypothetical protein [Verrucomicrobiae bacterium]